jgi:hypothetical protein
MDAKREGGSLRSRACVPLLAAAMWLAGTTGTAPAAAGELYKCGRNFQDRPCENNDVQQRFSRVQGTFAIEQVNGNTDRDCARLAAEGMTWWNRIAAGEPLASLHAEIQAQKTSRYEKSLMRDVVTSLSTYRGTPREVRSQFESQCMAYKVKNGYPTERQLAEGADRQTQREESAAAMSSRRQFEAEQRRTEAEARRAEFEAQRVDAANRRAVAPRRLP